MNLAFFLVKNAAELSELENEMTCTENGFSDEWPEPKLFLNDTSISFLMALDEDFNSYSAALSEGNRDALNSILGPLFLYPANGEGEVFDLQPQNSDCISCTLSVDTINSLLKLSDGIDWGNVEEAFQSNNGFSLEEFKSLFNTVVAMLNAAAGSGSYLVGKVG